jgi:hypothetical protein
MQCKWRENTLRIVTTTLNSDENPDGRNSYDGDIMAMDVEDEPCRAEDIFK